jgi:hypothetical protein
MTIKEIGCCGAYCRTCSAFTANCCRGCKLGYEDGQRDINKSRCRIKLCCFRDKGLDSCADCVDYAYCAALHSFYHKNGYKYKKYHQAIEYIRKHGYDSFISRADAWTGPYGRLGDAKPLKGDK